MSSFSYDLHIHSCLSPCADNDMTPNNIAGTASLAGIDIMALTDHNSAANCPAFFEAAENYGVIPVAGMELTTSEDIHAVCLFETLDGALAFGEYVYSKLIKIPNRPDIFGDQLIMNGSDEVIRREAFLLSNASGISIDSAGAIAAEYGGVAYPAHIDRQANSVTAVLGAFPDCGFTCAGFHDKSKIPSVTAQYPQAKDKLYLVSSDAHFLWDIRDKDNYITLDCRADDHDAVRRALINKLRTGADG